LNNGFVYCNTCAEVFRVGVFVNCDASTSASELDNFDARIIELGVFVNYDISAGVPELGKFVSCNIGAKIIGLDNTVCTICILVL
ncbi:18879_t:CDS:1, partial [Racocetra fulgida]